MDRIQKLLNLLGNPQNKIKSIHIAGSKGKGSTCALTATILQKAGYKVGLYTSPHLNDIRERIRLLGHVQEIWARELPSIPLFYRADVSAVQPGMTGWRPTGSLVPETWNCSEWALGGAGAAGAQ